MGVPGLILGLLFGWLVQTQQQYYGSRVSSIALSGSESDADIQVIPIHVGDILTPQNVRAAIQALYDTGHYSNVAVDATTAVDQTTALTFQLRPFFFFSTFKLEPEDLLERPLSSYFRLPFGEKFSTSAIDKVVQDTTNLLVSEGYFQATITPSFATEQQTHLIFVTLNANAGPKAKVGVVHIMGGEETFTEKELADAFGLKTGDDYLAAKRDKGVSEIRSKFAELRFLNTKVTAEPTFRPISNRVDLEVTVQPGQFALVQTRGFDISNKKLRELVPIYEEAAVDPDLVEEGRVRITRYMQQEGYYDATVEAETIEVDPSLGNAIQINYTIVPGAKHEIVAVVIDGNRFFSTEDLRKRMKTRKGQLLDHGVFSADILEEDRRTIEAMYRNAGFEGTVVKAMPQDVDHAITVVIQIDEGTQLPVATVKITGNMVFPTEQLRDAIRLTEGDMYAPAAIDQARAALTQFYFSKGYADARVERTVERVGNTAVAVTFQITEGAGYQIGAIIVEGTTLTRDKVIRRTSGLHEYTPFNPEAVLEAQQKLYATGLFSRVEIVWLDQGLPGTRNILIQVEDAKPILLTYGIGYQDYEYVRGTFEITHNNLFGLQRSISFRLRLSSRERLGLATYHEPRLLNHELDGFASTFIEHTERPFFSANRIDFSLQVLKRITTRDSFLVTSSYQTVNIGDIRTNPHSINDPTQVGPCQICQIGSISSSMISDHRNDLINPTGGMFNSTAFQVANRALGSELDFTSLYNQTVFYRPLRNGALATSFRFGWAHPYGPTAQFAPGQTQQLPATQRFFAGGSTTLRGFSLDSARPSSFPNLEGGNVLTLGNVEYRFPLKRFPISNFGAALFYDTGNVFPNIATIRLGEFTHTLGAGLRYQTPFGPARLDFGFNMFPKTRPDGTPEPRMKVFFTLGNAF